MSILEYLYDSLDKLGSPYPNLKLNGLTQLGDMITLLGLEYNVQTDVDQLIEEYNHIESVPRRKRTQEVDLAWNNCYKIEKMINQIKELLIEDKL